MGAYNTADMHAKCSTILEDFTVSSVSFTHIVTYQKMMTEIARVIPAIRPPVNVPAATALKLLELLKL